MRTRVSLLIAIDMRLFALFVTFSLSQIENNALFCALFVHATKLFNGNEKNKLIITAHFCLRVH